MFALCLLRRRSEEEIADLIALFRQQEYAKYSEEQEQEAAAGGWVRGPGFGCCERAVCHRRALQDVFCASGDVDLLPGTLLACWCRVRA